MRHGGVHTFRLKCESFWLNKFYEMAESAEESRRTPKKHCFVGVVVLQYIRGTKIIRIAPILAIGNPKQIQRN